MSESTTENSCQLCAKGELVYTPLLYCSSCSALIKHEKKYYTDTDKQYSVCTSCYNLTGRSFTIGGNRISKASLDKKKNCEELNEPWVQCGKCEGWQHEVCALFNHKRDEEGDAEYICPKCYLQEIQSGERVPLPHDVIPCAKDLPTTSLSDHIEKRLHAQLENERGKAKSLGERADEIPKAEDLVVRVVLSIERKSKVMEGFLDAISEMNYPEEFPYRSKVILLFQKIDGVDVCLFAMYVQEYGSECAAPNQRCVYISYLDSVKYFKPDKRRKGEEGLRTIVYHEILIGYLDYCKKEGFLTCYIWSCPPLKGNSYILCCHPENQEIPTPDRLRKWYQSLLRKAIDAKVVAGDTNLYKHFFIDHPKQNAKVTLLPYFDGDYWPVHAEEVIRSFKDEYDDDKLHREGKKEIRRRALKYKRGCDPSKNTLIENLKQKLEEYISQKHENFIVVQLQHYCSYCCQPIESEAVWGCDHCKSFKLCGKCYSEEQTGDGKHPHPLRKLSYKKEMKKVTPSPDEKDEIICNELFEDRQTFLCFCEKNNYRHDTLRRAKHSTMMILYHLHNRTSAASHDQNEK